MAAAGGAGSDPYASSKANLRETIKWLAGIFSALAAFVIGSTPLSGLGSPALSEGARTIGSLAILVGFCAICAAVVIMIRLLRSDLLYLSDLDPRASASGGTDTKERVDLRADIDAHIRDFFSEYRSLAQVFDLVDKANTNAQVLGAAWTSARAANAPQAQVEAAKADYDEQLHQLEAFRDGQQDVLAYGSYRRFYGRLRNAIAPLMLLGIVALGALFVFTYVVRAPKDEKSPTVIVVPVSSAPVPPIARAEQTDAGTVLFRSGSAVIDDAGRAAVERARNVLLSRPDAALLLIARTDTVGTELRNVGLARERADAVRSLLTLRRGISGARIFVAEMPKSDLPRVTAEQQDNSPNRSVGMYLVDLKR